MSAPRYEIADFHPETGHLHACTDRAGCDCAAQLFCIAEDALLAARRSPSSTPTSPTIPADEPLAKGEQVAE